jgi:hypothetical protein
MLCVHQKPRVPGIPCIKIYLVRLMNKKINMTKILRDEENKWDFVSGP